MVARIIGFSLAVSILMGLFGACVAILGGDSRTVNLSALASTNGIAALLSVGAVASLPVSLPLGIIGGVVAANVTKRYQGRGGVVSWIGRGSTWGAMLGFSGAAFWFGLGNIGVSQFLPLVLRAATYAGLIGVVAGAIVAAYCRKLALR